jgi:hypothetical protein
MLVAGAAKAAPGVGEKVYGATLEAGVTEVEARYGRLTGGAADGEDGLVLEVAHSFSDRFYGGALIELEREPGGDREVEAFGLEGIVTLGRIEALALDVAVYGEYELVREGTDAIELKTLLEHEAGPFDARLNLIAEKHLDSGDAFEFGYAASADWAVVGEIRAGLQAFGEFGELDHFAGRNEHYLGPVIKAEIEHLPGGSELEIETGWLKALGAADDETDGQFRLLLEWETRF